MKIIKFNVMKNRYSFALSITRTFSNIFCFEFDVLVDSLSDIEEDDFGLNEIKYCIKNCNYLLLKIFWFFDVECEKDTT